jgi:hypothetical protein
MQLDNPDSIDLITRNELEETVNKFGSLISILSNKPISCVTFFVLIQKNKDLQKVLLELSDTSWYDMVQYLAHRYPVLNKSKKIK